MQKCIANQFEFVILSILSHIQFKANQSNNWIFSYASVKVNIILLFKHILFFFLIVRGDRDSRATLMPIYGDLYQIKL